MNRQFYIALTIADESGVLLYLNDSSGNMVYTSGFYTATPRAIEVIDLITINQLGTIQFFKNMGESGLVAVGSPVQAQGSGPLKALDVLQNNRRELVVELAPNIEQVFDVGDIFGFQPIASSGKRSIRYVYFDHLGSAKMLINDQRRVVWPELKGGLNRLSPFGKDLVVGDDPPDIVRESYLLNFTNKEIDYTLDLHYFGARYYHSTFPRFISPDPVGGNPMYPITWNRYLYCRNDPMNYLDPDGEDAIAMYDDKIHTALISGPVDGQWRYDSFGMELGSENHRHGVYYFDSEESAMEFAYENGYTQYERWFTRPRQDQKMWDEADKWHSDNGENYKRKIDYDLASNNCGTFVKVVLEAGLPPHRLISRLLVVPEIFFKVNKQIADTSGTIEKSPE